MPKGQTCKGVYPEGTLRFARYTEIPISVYRIVYEVCLGLSVKIKNGPVCTTVQSGRGRQLSLAGSCPVPGAPGSCPASAGSCPAATGSCR